jgi:hypothetical protein
MSCGRYSVGSGLNGGDLNKAISIRISQNTENFLIDEQRQAYEQVPCSMELTSLTN